MGSGDAKANPLAEHYTNDHTITFAITVLP